MDQRDGCSDCIIDPDYKCINELLQPSFCYQCQQNCKVCEYQQRIIKCLQCHEGYYLKDNQCFKCKENCKTCESLEICKSCTYYPLQPKENGKCPYCEDTVGLVTVGFQCYSICGDGIIYQPTEECDDGNTVNDDGCDIYCKREKYFYCEGKSCTRIYPPKPIIISIEPENLEINERNFTLYYDSLLVSGINLANQITIEISDKQENIDYQVLLGIENFLLNINIRLLNSFQSNYLLIHFKSPEQIVGVNGLCQEVKSLQSYIYNYCFIKEDVKTSVQQTSESNTIILYIFGGMTVLAIFSGGLDAFWNLLDVLQILSYSNFIYTEFPFNLSSFLQAFEFGRLSFLKNLFQIEDILKQNIGEVEIQQYKPQIKFQDQVETSLFIINIQSTFSVFTTLFVMYWMSILLIKITTRIMNQLYQIYYQNLKYLIRLIKLEKLIKDKLLKYQRQFFWSILIRTHMSTAYDISFAIILQLQLQYSDMQSLIAEFSYILCYFACILQIGSVIFYISKIGQIKVRFINEQFQNKYGEVLFESLDMKQIGKIKSYYNTFLYLKRHIYMLLLLSLVNVPQLQTICISILSLFHIMFLVYVNPLELKAEYIKQLISEILMYFLNMQFFIFTIDDQILFLSLSDRFLIGWLQVVEISLIMISQFIIDIYQQIKVLKKYFGFEK